MSESDLSRKIRDLRALHGLTLEQVAQQVGVGRSTIRKWETGMIENMRRDKIAKLASALHTTPGYLMGWDDTQIIAGEEKAPTDNGKGLVDSSVQKDENIIRIAGRDGSFVERRLTDSELAAFKAMLDALPEAPDDL